MRNKINNIKSKVYSEFFIGSAIAWFSIAVISSVLDLKFDIANFVKIAVGLLETLLFLRFAIQFRKKESM